MRILGGHCTSQYSSRTNRGRSQLIRALSSSQSLINLDPEEREQGNPINLEEEEEDEEGDGENPIVL